MKLAALAIAGQGLSYALGVLLARRLGVEGFEAYAVASAAFVVMVTVATRGLDKFALRIVPRLIERRDWARARGFVLFGVRSTLSGSLITGAIVSLAAWWVGSFSRGSLLAIWVSALSLPVGAMAHFLMEAMTAVGLGVRATVIFRVTVPALAFTFAAILVARFGAVGGAAAVACWGVAWVVGLTAMVRTYRRATPPELLRAEPIEQATGWKADALPFWLYRILSGLTGYAGVIALDRLQSSAAAVGAYAASAGTVGLATVLVTATNRFYSRRLSLLIERRDPGAMRALHRERLKWLLPTILVLLVTAFLFTRQLLTLFNPEFVADGLITLRLLAATTAITMLLALAPTYLKFRQRDRMTFVTLACAATVQLVLLLLLVPRLGATGAALAYAVSAIGRYVTFALIAKRDLARL